MKAAVTSMLMAVVVASVTSFTWSVQVSTEAQRLAAKIGHLENEIAALTYRIAQDHVETQARLKLIRADAEKARGALK